MIKRNKPCGYVYRDTPCGKIKGVRKEDCIIFEGIRFARAKRWGEPEIIESWDGEYDATKYGPWCSQHSAFFDHTDTNFSKFYYDQPAEKQVTNFSEDCLNLNIWASEDAKDAPVLVFVHGGSFVNGGNSGRYIKGDDYAKRGVILVSVNYRLNAFATVFEGEHTGNYALKDQIAAFKWIKRNISAFGGDPNRIVAAGESAGALSLQCLLYSPEAKGLFNGTILMSGGGNLDVLGIPCDPMYTQRTWEIVEKKYGVESVEGLMDLSTEEIYRAWFEASSTDIGLYNNNAKPIVDGKIIPKPPKILMQEKAITDLPCIIGMSSEDMFPYILYTKAVEWANYQEDNGRSPVYGYYLTRQLPGDDVGAYHGCDLWYAFGSLDMNWRPFTEIDYRISEDMIDYFCAFTKNLNTKCEGLAEWTPITRSSTKFISFGDEPCGMCEPPVDKLEMAIQNTKPFPGM